MEVEGNGDGPEPIFKKLLMFGFQTPDHALNAIQQFAKIEQCQWARDMLVVSPNEKAAKENDGCSLI
jgi:hypothetical protein